MTRHRTYRQKSMNPLPGISPANCTALGHRAVVPPGHDDCGGTQPYRALAPVGAGGSALILNSEFCILNWTFTFSAKEKDVETGLSYFGSRYYSSNLSIWLSVDPMAHKYPSLSPYVYCANNPVKLVDPNGEEWVDADGNKITDHSKIKVYIFYDPESFSSQTKQMYKDAIEKYGEGSVALSSVTTTAEFIQDWSDMASDNIREVALNYHGGPQTINLDYKTKQYLTSTGDGRTPMGNPATNVEDLPNPSGNVRNAQLNINSCRSNDKSGITRGKTTIAQAFRNSTSFFSIRTTDKKVNYWYWFSPNRPHPEDNSDWTYLYRIDFSTKRSGFGLVPSK